MVARVRQKEEEEWSWRQESKRGQDSACALIMDGLHTNMIDRGCGSRARTVLLEDGIKVQKDTGLHIPACW